MSGTEGSTVPPELNVTCRSCGNRTVLRRRMDTDAGRVIIDDCVICDRGRCPRCTELVPGTAKYCSGCGAHLLGPDEETSRFLQIAGMRRCSDCSTYVSEDSDHSCTEEPAPATPSGTYVVMTMPMPEWWHDLFGEQDDQAA